MITTKLYTIYDSKAAMYAFPFKSRTNGEAIRAFTNIANDKQHLIGQHPEDYILFHCGTYDDTFRS